MKIEELAEILRVKSLPQRIIDRFTINNKGCWIFRGDPSSNGYQRLWIHGHRFMAHRYIYHLFNSRVNIENKQLDHLCCNRNCCNPEHLEPVTAKVNSIRVHRRRKKV